MYKVKPCHDCEMPAPGTALRVLVLNGSLRHGDALSNTDELSRLGTIWNRMAWKPRSSGFPT